MTSPKHHQSSSNAPSTVPGTASGAPDESNPRPGEPDESSSPNNPHRAHEEITARIYSDFDEPVDTFPDEFDPGHPGLLTGTTQPYLDEKAQAEADAITRNVETVVERCSVFVDGHRVRGNFNHREALEEVRRRGSGYVWLGLNEPSQQQMLDVAKAYDVHELIAEDAVTAHQRPKVERYDDQLFFVIRSVSFTEHESVNDAKEIIETGEVQIIIGADFIITIRHGKPSTIAGIRTRMATYPDQCILGPSAVAWMIADNLVDEYLRIAAELASDVEELETEVFTPNNRFDIETIYMLKREILEMRHAIDPLVPAMRLLITSHKDMLSKPLRSYFRDVLDHELLAVDQVASYDERLTSLINAGVAKITLQDNTDMRKISAVVGMAALPTMIAGIYGMNFDNMPELHTRYGYFITIFVMVFCVLLSYYLLKRNRWL